MHCFGENLFENIKKLPPEIKMILLNKLYVIDKARAMYLELIFFKSSSLIEEFLKENEDRLKYFNLPLNFDTLCAQEKLATYCCFEMEDIKYIYDMCRRIRWAYSCHFNEKEFEQEEKIDWECEKIELNPWEQILLLFGNEDQLWRMGFE